MKPGPAISGETEGREGGIRPQGLADGGGDLPGGSLERSGQGQGTVGLEVAEFGPGGRRQLGIEGLARLPGGLRGLRECALHGGRQPGVERTEDRQHGEIRRVAAGRFKALIMPLHPCGLGQRVGRWWLEPRREDLLMKALGSGNKSV